ncbi:MAG: TetR/AcrR family transcriptional regulator [Clostridia bacterium]|nr:TetR/AcrR family transcriptional regulator [Clostridia bacterium]MBR3273682.1 TetR/AcrR family transcriptional regulator [Clostridia bacterium]
MKKGDIRRVQILDAAEKLFFEQGYDRTSVQDILGALQMSKGGFYHYFDAKDSVLRAVSERRAQGRFDQLNAAVYGSRRSPVEKLNMVLGMANLFEAEETPFAALMLKLCYRDKDAAMNAHRRRVLVDRLLPTLNDVIAEGVADGSFHTRRPMEIGRLLLLLACDVNDEVCGMLADNPDNPDVMLPMIELLNTWREGTERLVGAPYGTVVLFEAGKLIDAWQAAAAMLDKEEETE